MQRRSLLACVAAAIGAAALPAQALSAASGWRTILDGKSLKGWTPVGKAEWVPVDGAIQSVNGAGFLVSDRTYGDFQLRPRCGSRRTPTAASSSGPPTP